MSSLPTATAVDLFMDMDDDMESMEEMETQTESLQLKGNIGSSDPRETMMNLLNLQKLDGSFEPNDALAKLLKVSTSKILSSCPPGLNEKVWVTAVVLAFFILKLSSLEAEWELVLSKSKTWITKYFKTTPHSQFQDVSALTHHAKSFLSTL
jgi:hypothetical protein